MEYKFVYGNLLFWKYLLCLIFDDILAQVIGTQEYCPHQAFDVSCTNNEVIIIESAVYGRMRFGKCMKEDHGHVGCSADIIYVLDKKCSGRKRCSVPIPIANLEVSGCPNELQHYLEASYRCQPVQPTLECTRHQHMKLIATNSSKYLIPQASPYSGKMYTGSKHCPWVLSTEPGRQINLILFNFNRSDSLRPLQCDKIIVIKDNNMTSEHSICNYNRRETSIYVSMSNTIEIYIFSVDETLNSLRIMIAYKAIGCANIAKMENAFIVRHDDELSIKCNHTGETFFLTCIGSEWMGQLHNCSRDRSGINALSNGRSSRFRYGWLLLIGIGVALGVALGIILLAAILAFVRRRKQDEKILNVSRHTSDPLLSETRENDDVSNYYERRIQTLATIGPRSPRISRESIYKDRCSLMAIGPHRGGGMAGHFHTLPSNYSQPYTPQQHLASNESPYCTCVQQQQQFVPLGQNNAQTSFITFKPGGQGNSSLEHSFIEGRDACEETQRERVSVEADTEQQAPCGPGVRHITAARSLDLLKDSHHTDNISPAVTIALTDTSIINNKTIGADEPKCTCFPMVETRVQNTKYQNTVDSSYNKSI